MFSTLPDRSSRRHHRVLLQIDKQIRRVVRSRSRREEKFVAEVEMCVNNEQVSKMAMATATAASRFPRSPRSPYRRHLHLREPVKPRLSRRIISSARVNLNCYWSKFAEAASVSSVAMLSSAAPDGSLDNEINENLANEIQNLCSN